MKVTARSVGGGDHTFDISESTTVDEFRTLVARWLERPINSIRLVFQGKFLSDLNRTLVSYGIVDGFAVHAVEQGRHIHPDAAQYYPSGSNGSSSSVDPGTVTERLLPPPVRTVISVLRDGAATDAQNVEELVRRIAGEMVFLPENIRTNMRISRENNRITAFFPPFANSHIPSPALERLQVVDMNLQILRFFRSTAEEGTGICDIADAILAGQELFNLDFTDLATTFSQRLEDFELSINTRSRGGHMGGMDNTSPDEQARYQRINSQLGPDVSHTFIARHALTEDLADTINVVNVEYGFFTSHFDRFSRILRCNTVFDFNQEELTRDPRANVIAVYVHHFQRCIHRFSHIHHALSDLSFRLNQPQPRRLYPQYEGMLIPPPVPGELQIELVDPTNDRTNVVERSRNGLSVFRVPDPENDVTAGPLPPNVISFHPTTTQRAPFPVRPFRPHEGTTDVPVIFDNTATGAPGVRIIGIPSSNSVHLGGAPNRRPASTPRDPRGGDDIPTNADDIFHPIPPVTVPARDAAAASGLLAAILQPGGTAAFLQPGGAAAFLQPGGAAGRESYSALDLVNYYRTLSPDQRVGICRELISRSGSGVADPNARQEQNVFEEFFDAFVIRSIQSTPPHVLQDLREVAPNADQLRPEMIVPNLRYAGIQRVERNIDEDGTGGDISPTGASNGSADSNRSSNASSRTTPATRASVVQSTVSGLLSSISNMVGVRTPQQLMFGSISTSSLDSPAAIRRALSRPAQSGVYRTFLRPSSLVPQADDSANPRPFQTALRRAQSSSPQNAETATSGSSTNNTTSASTSSVPIGPVLRSFRHNPALANLITPEFMQDISVPRETRRSTGERRAARSAATSDPPNPSGRHRRSHRGTLMGRPTIVREWMNFDDSVIGRGPARDSENTVRVISERDTFYDVGAPSEPSIPAENQPEPRPTIVDPFLGCCHRFGPDSSHNNQVDQYQRIVERQVIRPAEPSIGNNDEINNLTLSMNNVGDIIVSETNELELLVRSGLRSLFQMMREVDSMRISQSSGISPWTQPPIRRIGDLIPEQNIEINISASLEPPLNELHQMLRDRAEALRFDVNVAREEGEVTESGEEIEEAAEALDSLNEPVSEGRDALLDQTSPRPKKRKTDQNQPNRRGRNRSGSSRRAEWREIMENDVERQINLPNPTPSLSRGYLLLLQSSARLSAQGDDTRSPSSTGVSDNMNVQGSSRQSKNSK